MPGPTVLSKADIEGIFDGAAASYDRVGPNIFAKFGERLVSRIPLGRGMHVLDVATGNGAVLLPTLERIGPEGHLIGIDASDGILRQAEQAVASRGATNVGLLKMDAEHLDFPDNIFDVVTCAFALFMFPDMEQALREMCRVCKPDGCVAVTYFNKVPPPFDPGWRVYAQVCTEYQIGQRMPQKLGLAPEELETILDRCGLRSIEIDSEVNDIIYTTGDDWWGFMLTMGSRATILGMDEETRARFKADYLARLRPAWREDGLHMSTSVIYARARR
jgi:O-methyltransferase/aklanonic acid methyltransferase